MDSNLLSVLLHQSESDVLDFKRLYTFSTGTDEQKGELLKDVLAMANAWKNSDAHIVIGVDEANGRAAAIPGVTDLLADHLVQQFINGKTNVPVQFHVEAVDHSGVTLNVISISETQQRPVFIKKPYGKLEAKSVYIRRGSSTGQADPDEIASMGAAAAQIEAAKHVPTLDLEWTSGELTDRLGQTAKVTSLFLTDPAPAPVTEEVNAGPLGRLLQGLPPKSGSGVSDIAQRLFPVVSFPAIGDAYSQITGRVSRVDYGAPTDED